MMNKFKKVVLATTLGLTVSFGMFGGGTQVGAEQFYSSENSSYNHLISQYINDKYDTIFTKAKYDKANTEFNKKRMENWNYVFSYDTKNKDGKTIKAYTSISQDYWKVSNTSEPKEGVEYILVMKEVKENGQQWGQLQNIDAIEVKPKTVKNDNGKVESVTTECSDPNKKSVTTTIKRTGKTLTKCIDK